jgi:hypothetical protein
VSSGWLYRDRRPQLAGADMRREDQTLPLGVGYGLLERQSHPDVRHSHHHGVSRGSRSLESDMQRRNALGQGFDIRAVMTGHLATRMRVCHTRKASLDAEN